MPFVLLEEETRAARERSPELLRAAIVKRVVEGADEWRKDARDFMVALAPLRHCADDVTPAAFGFVFDETADGPRYGFESIWTDEELALGPEELERRWMQRHGLRGP